MPAQVAAQQPTEAPAYARAATRPRPRPRPRTRWRRQLVRLFRRFRKPVVRAWRTLRAKTRFRIKVLAAAALLLAPLWGLNLTVAFLGHSVVFPLSPFFLREKMSAIAAYARHRPLCLVFGHGDTDHLVNRAEARHHVPRGLLAAVVQIESRGFPHRISAAGAMGPGQLMPATARELGVDDPFDSAQNIDGAARLLAGHLDRFHGNVRWAVAAYNAGAGAVHGHVPSNGQTPAYVTKVMQAYAALRPRPVRPPRPPQHHRGPAFAVTGVTGER